MMSINEQARCAERELAKRRAAYPKLIAAGKLSPEKADYEIECMSAIAATLKRQELLAEASEEMEANERKRNATAQAETARRAGSGKVELPNIIASEEPIPGLGGSGLARLAAFLARK